MLLVVAVRELVLVVLLVGLQLQPVLVVFRGTRQQSGAV
jgi:hypothetical protein